MAPKKPTALEQPPRADYSSEDEEEVSIEEEEEEVSEEPEEEEVSEESEEEEPKKTDPKPDSDEDGSDSGSDEEVTPVVPVKPVGVQSTKMGTKSKQKQPDVAPATAPASTVAVAKFGKKRPVESKADGKDSKKLKKVADVEDRKVAEKKVGEETKKQLFLRLFSEDDEIEILKALVDYSAKKSIDPFEDFNGFHDILKKSMHVDVSSTQLADKIRRMRKKFEKNASKTKVGVEKTFGKPHEQLCYNISKKIWGKSASASGVSELKANGKVKMTPKLKEKSSLQIPQVLKKKNEHARENSSSLFCLTELAKTKDVVGMGLSDDLLKKGFELLSDEARAALEEKWKKMATAELELYNNRLELSCEHVKLSRDALKASGHRG